MLTIYGLSVTRSNLGEFFIHFLLIFLKKKPQHIEATKEVFFVFFFGFKKYINKAKKKPER